MRAQEAWEQIESDRRHAEMQKKVRAEIAATRTRNGGGSVWHRDGNVPL